MTFVLAVAIASGIGVAWAGADFVESRFEVGGDLLAYETPDVDGDARGDVLLAAREGNERVLRLHLQTPAGGFQVEPTFRLALPQDVVGYALFDLREEPGREIVLLTRTGVFSVSTTRKGLRGNLRRELSAPLFPDLSAADDVLRWDWVADIDGDGRAELLVPSEGALVALAVTASSEGGRSLSPVATLPLRVEAETHSPGVDIRVGRARVDVRTDLPALFPSRPGRAPTFGSPPLLRRSESWRLPRLLDWDGDGRLDLVDAFGEQVEVRRQTDARTFPARESFALPSSDGDDEDRSIRLVDVDGDGRPEAVRFGAERDGLGRDYAVTVHRRDGDGFAKTPVARVKLNAGNARFTFHDVDSDGRQDLIVRAVELPTGLDQLAAIRIDTRVLVFRGGEDGGLSSRPDARWERSLKPDDLARIRESFLAELEGDFDGDGLSDLLVVRPDGLLQVLPLRRDGDGLSFGAEPLSTHLPRRPVRDARPADLSHDGVGDLVLRHDDGLTVFVSRAGDGR